MDYRPEEPGELFYRLNQLTNLTAAEQRNAFFGPVRKQIKDLVQLIEARPDFERRIGFSNARMSYDDVLARLLCTLENGTLARKITAGSISDRFRSSTPFSEAVVDRTAAAIELLLAARTDNEISGRLNKATLFTWLCFCSQLTQTANLDKLSEVVRAFMAEFQEPRTGTILAKITGNTNEAASERALELIDIFHDRATSRVADVSSVVLRDFVLWYFFHLLKDRWPLDVFSRFRERESTIKQFEDLFRQHRLDGRPDDMVSTDTLLTSLKYEQWGRLQ
ncbi:MAG: hypothetical protein WB611_26955 [Stellaceae bacterium]